MILPSGSTTFRLVAIEGIENRHGASAPSRKPFLDPQKTKTMEQTVAEQLLDILEKARPRGYTAIQLARMVFGPLAQQPQVNSELHKLMRRGLVERRGVGGGNLPFVYHRTNKPRN